MKKLEQTGKSALVYLALLVSAISLSRADTSVNVGTGTAKLGGLLQAWTTNDTTSSTAKWNFRLRRAEIKFSGAIAESSRWFVMMDPAKSLKAGAISTSNDNKVLQDLGVALSLLPEFEFLIGQFKTPTTAEGLDSSAELWLPERSLSGRTFGDKREPGAMLTYKGQAWKISAMVSNGQATNADDGTNGKDLSVRFDVSPVDSLKLGAFTTAGDFNYGAKGRWGGNARFSHDAFTLRGEAVSANTSGAIANGWVIEGAYSLNEDFQPVARFDGVDDKLASARKSFAFGLNYYLFKHNSKVQLAYGILDNMSGGNGSPAIDVGRKGTLLTLAFQAAI